MVSCMPMRQVSSGLSGKFISAIVLDHGTDSSCSGMMLTPWQL